MQKHPTDNSLAYGKTPSQYPSHLSVFLPQDLFWKYKIFQPYAEHSRNTGELTGTGETLNQEEMGVSGQIPQSSAFWRDNSEAHSTQFLGGSPVEPSTSCHSHNWINDAAFTGFLESSLRVPSPKRLPQGGTKHTMLHRVLSTVHRTYYVVSTWCFPSLHLFTNTIHPADNTVFCSSSRTHSWQNNVLI